MTGSEWNSGITNGKRRLIAALLACALVLLTHLACNVTFLNNDDTNIMYALAGYRTGAPFPAHRFINVALSAAVSGLYRMLPTLPWWALYQIGVLAVSLTVIFSCLLKLIARRGLPLWKGLAACILLYLTVFVYPVLTMSFTLTAGMLGTASAMLVLAYDPEADGRGTGTALGSLALLMLCFFTRNSAGISMLCFWGAAAFYRLLAERGDRKRTLRTLAFGAAGGILAVCCILLNNWGVRAMNPPAYPAFEEARGRFTDYPHIAYADDPAFFADLGWDKTVYDLADNLCFLDTHITAETMSAVMGAPLQGEEGTAARLLRTLPALVSFFRGSGIAQYMVAVPALLTLLALAFYGVGRRNGLRGGGRGEALICALCIALGAFALCFYLSYAGRFPVRTFQLIVLPAAALPAALCVRLYERMNAAKPGTLLLLALSAALLSWSLAKTGEVALRYDKRRLAEENSAAEAYCMARPGNVYITDVTSLENLAAFTVYPEKKPVNLVDWGGTAMYSGWKEQQLAANGISDFTGSMFRKDNVFFLTGEDGEKLGILYAYLAAHEGAVGYTRVELVTEDVGVYRFMFSEDAA